MKKMMIASVIAASALLAGSAFAGVPDINTYRFECPHAAGGVASERLTNYGSYISGMGEENLGSHKSKPIFRGVPSAGVPIDLANYDNAGTLYNDNTGRITCLYTSSVLGEDKFNVSYVLGNGKHGYVLKSDDSRITVKIPQGLAS